MSQGATLAPDITLADSTNKDWFTLKFMGSLMLITTLIIYIFLVAISHERRLYIRYMHTIHTAYLERCRAGVAVRDTPVSEAYVAYKTYLYYPTRPSKRARDSSLTEDDEEETIVVLDYHEADSAYMMDGQQRIEI
jgi:hypothetical protein